MILDTYHEPASSPPVVVVEEKTGKRQIHVLAIDTSGSTGGVSKYWEFVRKIYDSISKSGSETETEKVDKEWVIISWSHCAEIISKESLLKYIENKRGINGGTDTNTIIPLLANMVNEYSGMNMEVEFNLCLITDGQVGDRDFRLADASITKEGLGLKFVNTEVHLINTGTEPNLSVSMPFTRACKFTVYQDDTLLASGDNREEIDFSKYENLEYFLEHGKELARTVYMKYLDSGNGKIKDKISALEKHLCYTIMSNLTKDNEEFLKNMRDPLFMREFSDDEYAKLKVSIRVKIFERQIGKKRNLVNKIAIQQLMDKFSLTTVKHNENIAECKRLCQKMFHDCEKLEERNNYYAIGSRGPQGAQNFCGVIGKGYNSSANSFGCYNISVSAKNYANTAISSTPTSTSVNASTTTSTSTAIATSTNAPTSTAISSTSIFGLPVVGYSSSTNPYSTKFFSYSTTTGANNVAIGQYSGVSTSSKSGCSGCYGQKCCGTGV